MNERLENEKISKLLLSLAIPSILAQLATLIYNMVDRIYIGQLADGALAIAGIGLCTSIITIITAFTNLFGRGGAPLASIRMGEKRMDIAKLLEQNVIKQLADLKMKNTTFKVHFDEMPSGIDNTYTLDGLDKVEFLFSANKGETEKSLSKTISGGEMSRFMLALKTVLGTKDDPKTLVFDEIDSGVSGEIGYKVGEKLYSLSLSSQILCITHLPQVTALADNHILVYKNVVDGKTISEIKTLSKEELVKYLSTLLGGYDSETSKLHAEELLEMAKHRKLDLNK